MQNMDDLEFRALQDSPVETPQTLGNEEPGAADYAAPEGIPDASDDGEPGKWDNVKGFYTDHKGKIFKGLAGLAIGGMLLAGGCSLQNYVGDALDERKEKAEEREKANIKMPTFSYSYKDIVSGEYPLESLVDATRTDSETGYVVTSSDDVMTYRDGDVDVNFRARKGNLDDLEILSIAIAGEQANGFELAYAKKEYASQLPKILRGSLDETVRSQMDIVSDRRTDDQIIANQLQNGDIRVSIPGTDTSYTFTTRELIDYAPGEVLTHNGKSYLLEQKVDNSTDDYAGLNIGCFDKGLDVQIIATDTDGNHKDFERLDVVRGVTSGNAVESRYSGDGLVAEVIGADDMFEQYAIAVAADQKRKIDGVLPMRSTYKN